MLSVAALGTIMASGMVGCIESDGFLIDPSVVGRWEHTPTIVPVLERIDVIERDTGDFVDTTPVIPDDLIPEPIDYRVSAGDFVQVDIFDFLDAGAPGSYQRPISARGFIDIPQIGQIFVLDLTRAEIEVAIAEAIVNAQILDDPLVTVQLLNRREETFSIFGSVPNVGRFAVPFPDYRLLQAITDAGGVPPTLKSVFVIRQVPLTDEVTRGRIDTPGGQGDDPDAEGVPMQDSDDGQSIIDLIDELTAPEGDSADGAGEGGVIGLSAFGGERDAPLVDVWSGSDSPRSFSVQPSVRANRGDSGARSAMQPTGDTGMEPIIDLPGSPERSASPQGVQGASAPSAGVTEWMFLNGRWVQVTRQAMTSDSGLPEGDDPLTDAPPTADDLITQRVIEVPVGPLLQGVAQFNIVIRPGDVINVPGPETGLVYVGGPGIFRPGVYALPSVGRMTLTKAIISAGGLSAVGIPERVDLTRMIGDDRQATVRLNLKAIMDGTQPDLFLKPDDVVNVGTNFWATPLAVIRGGFRASYGFGFLLDRNFGNDVFGAPPSNIGG